MKTDLFPKAILTGIFVCLTLILLNDKDVQIIRTADAKILAATQDVEAYIYELSNSVKRDIANAVESALRKYGAARD